MPQKLGIKSGVRLALVQAPDDFAVTLGTLPPGVVVTSLAKATSASGATLFDVIVCFARALPDLGRDLAVLRTRLNPSGGLWIAWPKRASGIATDVSESAVRERGLAAGLVDNKVCAIDPVWSGLRFVVRLADRPRPGGTYRGAGSPRR